MVLRALTSQPSLPSPARPAVVPKDQTNLLVSATLAQSNPLRYSRPRLLVSATLARPMWYPRPGCWCQPFLPGVAHTGLLLLLLLSAAAPSVLRRDAEAEGRARGVVLPGGVPRGELEVEEASCLSILQSSLTGGFVHPQAPRPRRRKGRENRRRRSELTVQETHSAGADWTVYISITVLFSCPHLRTLFRSTSKPQRFKAHQWPPSWLSIVTTGF